MQTLGTWGGNVQPLPLTGTERWTIPTCTTARLFTTTVSIPSLVFVRRNAKIILKNGKSEQKKNRKEILFPDLYPLNIAHQHLCCKEPQFASTLTAHKICHIYIFRFLHTAQFHLHWCFGANWVFIKVPASCIDAWLGRFWSKYWLFYHKITLKRLPISTQGMKCEWWPNKDEKATSKQNE